MKRRLFVFALVLSLLVGTLSGCGKSANVKTVDAMINAIGEVTLDSEDAILEAEEAVSALSSQERGELSYYSDLRRMRSELNALKAEEVDALIKAIGSNVTLESESAVQAARDAYDALTKDMKLLVTKLSDLEAAEKTIKRLKEDPDGSSENDEDSKPEESSSEPEDESSSKPEESSSKPEESSSKPEESSSKPEESSSKPEESSSKPEESSSSEMTSQEKIDACNAAIAAIEFNKSTLYNLTQVDAAIEAFNKLTDAEKDALDDEYKFWLCLYELDLYNATVDNGYLASANYKHARATEAEAANTIWLYSLTYDIDDNDGMTIYFEYENLSGKTISRVSFVIFLTDDNGDVIQSTNSQGSGPFVSWFLHDYDLEPGHYDPGEDGWGPMYGAAGQNTPGGFTLYAIEIEYEDGTSLRITNSTLLSIYGADGP